MNFRSVAIAVAVPVIFPMAGRAQDWLHNFYANVDVNYLFQQDATIANSASSGSFSTSLGSETSKYKPGFRGDVNVGYNITKLWSVELDAGALWNTSDFVIASTQKYDVHVETYTIPVLANVVYKIPLKNKLSAYIGAGAGGAFSASSFSSSLFDPTDDTSIFVYQAELGLKYEFTKNMSLGVDYKFLGATDPTWKFTVPSSNVIIPPTQYSFTEKGFYTHAIGINFTWRF